MADALAAGRAQLTGMVRTGVATIAHFDQVMTAKEILNAQQEPSPRWCR